MQADPGFPLPEMWRQAGTLEPRHWPLGDKHAVLIDSSFHLVLNDVGPSADVRKGARPIAVKDCHPRKGLSQKAPTRHLEPNQLSCSTASLPSGLLSQRHAWRKKSIEHGLSPNIFTVEVRATVNICDSFQGYETMCDFTCFWCECSESPIPCRQNWTS